MNQKTKATVFIIIAGVCWGIIGLFSRILSAGGLSSVQITATRCMVTAVCIVIYSLITNQDALRIKIKDLWYFLGTGICSIVFFNICYFITIQQLTLSMAAVLLYLAPCFVMIMSALFFKEQVTVPKVIALLMAFTGCFLTTGIVGGGSITMTRVGVLTGISSGFGYALYSIFGRAALRKYSTLTVTAYTFIVASIALIPFCHIRELVSKACSGKTMVVSVLLLGVISTLVPFLLYTKGLETIESGKASVMAFIEPMVATITGIIIFKEAMTMQSILGIILIFCSIVLLNIKINSNK